MERSFGQPISAQSSRPEFRAKGWSFAAVVCLVLGVMTVTDD